MAKNMYIGGSLNKIDYSSSSYAEQINLGELTIAFVSVAPSSYNDSITPVWNDSLGKFVFPDGVTTTLVSSGGDWFNYVGSNANYVDFVSFAIPTENPNAYYSYEVDEAGADTRGKFTHSFVEDVARKIKSIYLGVDGVARKIKKVYIGDENRLARLCYEFKPSYLTFSSPSSFTLAVSDATKHWDGTLEYSTNTSTWSTWDGTTALSSATSGSDNVLYLRGTGNTVITGSDTNYKWVLTGSNISCVGNIENLLDYTTVESGTHPTMATYCYAYMFSGCTSLTQAPALPATTLANNCYDSMFYGCTSLTQAPALPATTLDTSCYYIMFYGCTSLTQAPALPATTLANDCYDGMFQGCTGLTQAPALPATTLVNDCYRSMFYGCTSLTQAPALPATTLKTYCYYNMFSSCSNLVQAPALPATKLATYCYQNMFQNCTSLTQAPALPATTLADNCYRNMFQNCTSLTQAPSKLPATTLATRCYSQMFQGCTGLTQAPALPATTLKNYCYSQMFQGCTGLTQAPDLPATKLVDYCYRSMFYGCTGLTQAPALPATTLKNYCYSQMLQGCTKIKLSNTRTGEYTQAYRIPTTGTGTTASNALSNMFTSTGGTFAGTPEINTTYYLSNTNTVVYPPTPYLTFSSPSSFTLAVNDGIKHWDGTLEYSTDASTWSTWGGTTTLSSATSGSDNVLYLRGTGNTVITGDRTNYKWVLTGSDISCIGNIENLLDYETVKSGLHPTMASYCYSNMFQGCTSLTQAPALPATTLVDDCYSYMFNGCTALTQSPALPATTLADYCYSYMFGGCKSLTQAPALPATTLSDRCYYQMFHGCTSLTQVPALPATTLTSYCYNNMFYGCTKIKLSSTQTGEYTVAYRIPTTGTGTTAPNDRFNMFKSTGGTFTGKPEINTTYYLSNTNTIV